MKQLNLQFAAIWQDYGALLLLAAGTAGLFALLGLLIWAKRTRRPLRPFALALSMNLALLLNAEGMWVIATGDLGLAPVFAALVFGVFEISFLTATSLAAEQYRRSTVYGPNGSVVSPGHPGPMLYIAALIALVSGVIVASNAHTGTEKLLRLTVPAVIFLMWWAALTAAGQKARRGRFAYSPRRLAERFGWLIPDDDPDLVRMAAERQARRMVINYYRVAANRWPQWWWRSRLFKDARTAGDRVVADVVRQLDRVAAFMTLLPEDRRTGLVLTGPVGARLPDLSAPASDQVPGQTPVAVAAVDMSAAAADLSGHDSVNPCTDVLSPADMSTPAVGGHVRYGEPDIRPEDADSAPTRQHQSAVPDTPPASGPDHLMPRPRRPETPSGAAASDPAGAAVGDLRWGPALQRLSDLLNVELRPADGGATGRPTRTLVAMLAPQVPELDTETVRAFITDYLLARANQTDGLSSQPWGELLPMSQHNPENLPLPAPGSESRSDEELLELFGDELDQVSRTKGLTRYRVEQVTGARRRQADRLKTMIESRAQSELAADWH